MFTPPQLVLAFVISSLIGLGFFLLFGKGWLRLIVYWLVAVIGFFIGQIISSLLNFSIFAIGSVNLLEATATCLIALFVTRALWKSDAAQ
ncbi:MAG: hypothetical protein EYC68_13280 [Chloroflexota bacterium]|nr:MAG: hypothetical protein EYC68_13280 [Chloroflexota bacterium]